MDLPTTAYSSFYAPHPLLGTSQPPPGVTMPAMYMHQGAHSPDQVVYMTPSPKDAYMPLEHVKDNPDRAEYPYTGNVNKSSVPIVTLNPNNFIGNPIKIPYVAESSTRKRPNTQAPETELDSLNAKRLKNREAARRWRQGKKDQISDLQGEVHFLKTKIDAMQTEMETLRIENQYLKQEISQSRQVKVTQPPPQSPNLSSHPQRQTPSSNEINFLPTPSLFLLCLFVFSLCLSFPNIPQRFPGTNLIMGDELSSSCRNPRLLDESTTPSSILAPILSIQSNSGTSGSWVMSLFSQVYQRLLPHHHNTLEPSLLKVKNVGEMNKRISSSLRLDRFL